MKRFVLLFALILSFTYAPAIQASEDGLNTLRTTFQNNEANIYVINIRTFNSKDLDGNDIIETEKGEEQGTFVNAIKRLDEIKGLGFNAIHVLPITPVGKIKSLGTAGSLYSMSDLTSINPELVDKTSALTAEEQLKSFIEECHKRDIRVIIDLPSCGSYDMFLQKPELFLTDREQNPIVPCDWTDVRLFKVYNENKTLNEDLFNEHKKFVDMIMKAGADGIRADVATIKPYEFWQKLISYARGKDKEFLFLAEASDSWTEPASPYAVFTNYKKLLDAGFDGFYGSYFNRKSWTSVNELKSQIELIEKINKNSKDKKSVIGSFATHDEQSPIITGGENLAINMIWLEETLPLNPYYVDGMLTGDSYTYKYENKKALSTATDNDIYYVHKGKMDIFNFSRKPQGGNYKILNEYYIASKLREHAGNVITKGSFKVLNSSNKNIFAYERKLDNKLIIVVYNNSKDKAESGQIKINIQITQKKLLPIRTAYMPKIKNGNMLINLDKGETLVFYVENLTSHK